MVEKTCKGGWNFRAGRRNLYLKGYKRQGQGEQWFVLPSGVQQLNTILQYSIQDICESQESVNLIGELFLFCVDNFTFFATDEVGQIDFNLNLFGVSIKVH